LELSRSPNPEANRLAKLIFLVAEEITDLLLDLLYDSKHGQFPDIKAIFKDQSQFNTAVIEDLDTVRERLSKIENTKPSESTQIKDLATRLQQEEDSFAEYKPTLEDLRAFSQGRLAEWVRRRFGGDSSDEQQR
jgi:hypothetical protein